MPADLYLKRIAINYFIKRGINNYLTQQYLRELNIDLNLIQRPFPYIEMPHPVHRKPIEISIIREFEFKLYTNCAINNGNVGSAFQIFHASEPIKVSKFKLAKYCSLFQAQLLAIKKALEFLNKGRFNNRTVTIFTNSGAILLALKDPNSKTYLAQSILINKYKLADKGIKIEITTPQELEEHQAIDITKQLASDGANSHQAISYDFILVPYIKNIILKKSIEIWDQRWSNSTKGIVTKNFFPSVMDRIRCKDYFKTDFYCTQAITGHGKFRKYFKRFNITRDDNCETCPTEVESYYHLIYDCIKYEKERSEMILGIEACSGRWPLTEKELTYEKYFDLFRQYCKNILE